NEFFEKRDRVSYLPFGRGCRCGGPYSSFPAIGTLSWLRTGWSWRRGTIKRTLSHDHCKATPTACARGNPNLSRVAAARHRPISARDRAPLRRTQEVDPRARGGDAV